MISDSNQHINAYQSVLDQPRLEPKPHTPQAPKWRLTYQDGPRLQIDSLGTVKHMRVEFWDDTDLVYSADHLEAGNWYKPSRHWWCQWTVKIYCDGQLDSSETVSLEGQPLTIEMGSASLGDTISFMGQLHTVIDTHKPSQLLVKTHKPWLFDADKYSEQSIQFIPFTETQIGNTMSVGVYYTMDQPWMRDEHKYDWRQQPLGKIAADRLGIEYKEIKPYMAQEYLQPSTQLRPTRLPAKSIVIATQSTAQAKYWNNPTGWQETIDWCNQNKIRVQHASKEGSELLGVEQLPEALTEVANAINDADVFVGISSGLSWFAWALGAKVVIISGFTDPYVEMETAHYINNHKVCHGCWGWDTFDKGDWNWCPAWKDTHRQFECTKQIESDVVIKKLKELII